MLIVCKNTSKNGKEDGLIYFSLCRVQNGFQRPYKLKYINSFPLPILDVFLHTMSIRLLLHYIVILAMLKNAIARLQGQRENSNTVLPSHKSHDIFKGTAPVTGILIPFSNETPAGRDPNPHTSGHRR